MKTETAILKKTAKLDNLLIFKACYRRFQFCNHSHEDFALGLMEEGGQKFTCLGKERLAEPGKIITVNPGDVHDGMSADGNPYRYRIIYLPSKLLKEVAEEMLPVGANIRFSSPVTEDVEIAGKLRDVFHLLVREDGDSLEAESFFYTILGTLLQRHAAMVDEEESQKEIPRPIELACEFINDMADHPISLDDIAGAAALSRYHFLRLFHSVKNMTPHAYLLQRRLDMAKELIRGGTPVCDAALQTCFSDQSHFSRRFKMAFGITPGQYRRAVC